MTTTAKNTGSIKKFDQRASGKERNTHRSPEVTTGPTSPGQSGEARNSSVKRTRTRARSGKAAPNASSAPTAGSRATKKQVCLALLSRSEGASIEELKQATGWQTHSVRGFLSGEVRKRMGRELVSEADAGGERRYRIVDAKTAS